ncbi:NACHT domain-containing protein [Actinoplanes teichomyceticus]|uniref:NACHT domain-containing protein n=1 Tax=Actinoplanes teichomyceticus TaxID=1867 RepID=A0A561VCU5_ACTTI|nr:NACHT domain-containing protein [Actinoplanes teichomyceticus]TWG09430.1 NACHT domain-containing protein [Actinoplanes teichomyceticus]GIF17095.1 hypothetical protein Ate01nite_71270 [Actinoplanes teichomyceticus]
MQLAQEDGWLDNADKIASIAGAVFGLLSLAYAVHQARRAAAAGEVPPSLWRRWRPRIALLCAVVAVGAALLSVWGLPERHRPAAVLTAAVAGAAGLAVLIVGWVSWLRSPKQLDPAVRRLLTAQLSETEFHRYRFGRLPVPGITAIRVEQHVHDARDPDAEPARVLDAEELVRDAPRAVVTGVPGAGKSTLAVHVTRAAADWWLGARVASRRRSAPFGAVMPVLVPARALADADVPVALATQWSQAGVEPEVFTRQPLRGTRWLVIVDGLDEISAGDVRARVLQRIGAFLARHPGTRLLVTTRALSAGELADLTRRGAEQFELRLFDADDLRAFAVKWLTHRLDSPVRAGVEAARFLAYLRTAQLTSIVRVPLLATMAMLVWESNRDRAAPAGRCALYHEFDMLLRSSREPRRDTPFERWLSGHLDDLLGELAAAYVWQRPPRLLPLAINWVVAHAPAEVPDGSAVEWITDLRGTLIDRGLCRIAPSFGGDEETPAEHPEARALAWTGNDITFVHATIAEYLAADPRRFTFSYAAFRRLITDGSTRGLALFALARGHVDPDGVIAALLDDDDPVSAGHVIADGIAVDSTLRQEVIERLLGRIADDHPEVADCIAVFTALAVAPDVAARLRAMIADGGQRLWTRVALADAFADVDADAGLTLLRELAASPAGTASDALWWARHRLAARAGQPAAPREPADPGSPPEPPGRLHPEPLGEIGRQAYRRTATDARQPSDVRLRAALKLHLDGVPAGTAVLRELARRRDAGADTCLEAAQWLLAAADPHGLDALRDLAGTEAGAVRVPADVRVSAALLLLTHDAPGALEVARRLATATDLADDQRRLLAAQLVSRGDPTGRQAVAAAARSAVRRGRFARVAGLLLAALGPASLTLLAARHGGARVGSTVFGGYFIGCAMVALAWDVGEPETSQGSMWQLLRELTRPLRALRGRAQDLAGQARRHLDDEWRTAVGSAAMATHVAWAGPTAGGEPARAQPLDLRRIPPSSPGRPVLLVGGPGSGKTLAVVRAARELLDRRDASDPIPVLLSLSRWDANGEVFADWVTDAVCDTYRVRRSLVSQLLRDHRLLLILDALDEVQPAWQDAAAEQIEGTALLGATVVATCRTDVFDQLSGAKLLRWSAVARMQPVRAADLMAYVETTVPADELHAWQPVFRELALGSCGPFADILTTPSTAVLALAPYLRTGRRPAELLRTVYDHAQALPGTTGGFFPERLSSGLAAGGCQPDHGVRWLRTLSRHMMRDSDTFGWWSLAATVPASRRRRPLLAGMGLVVAMVLTVVGAARPGWPAVAAAVATLCGLAALAARALREAPFLRGSHEPLVRAVARAAWQTSLFSAGCGFLAFGATGRAADTAVAAVAALGVVWTTRPGQFLLVLVHFAVRGELPLRWPAFLAAMARAGILTTAGPGYRFARPELRAAVDPGWAPAHGPAGR